MINPSKDFKPSESILEWAINSKTPSSAMIVGGNYPSDAPVSGGQECGLIVLGHSERKIVLAIRYNSTTSPFIWVRSVFRDNWSGGSSQWIKII